MKTGELYFRICRGNGWSTHNLTSHGAERLKKAGVGVGLRIPHGLLQLLDQYLECTPPCGAYKGQRQFESDDFQQMLLSPQPKVRRDKRRNPVVHFEDRMQLLMNFEPWELDEAA